MTRRLCGIGLDFDPGMGGDEVHRSPAFSRAKYGLLEEYGPDCYTEQPNGDLCSSATHDPEYMRGWLLGIRGRCDRAGARLGRAPDRRAGAPDLTLYPWGGEAAMGGRKERGQCL